MLKGLDPILSPELLYLIARMGHGDDIAIVDGNHPADSIAAATVSGTLVRLPGLAVERAVSAVLTLLPVDSFAPDPIRMMRPVDPLDAEPAAMRAIRASVLASGFDGGVALLDRFAFYAAARSSFGVVQCGDPRFYGNIIIRKGAIEG
jgi:L-fucose mutarotase